MGKENSCHEARPVSLDRQCLIWAGVLVSLYLLVYFAGWGRTLIGTEVWALHFAGLPLGEQMNAVRLDLVHPPLIYLLERAWLAVFGQTDSAARAIPLLVNIPAIALFTSLARMALVYWRLASFLFCGTYLVVGSTVNQIRMYGLGIMLVVAAILLWESWRRKPATGRLMSWMAVATLLVYTHFFGLLMLAGFLAANLLFGPRRRAFVAASLFVGVLYLPWFLYVLPVLRSRGLDTNLWWVHQLIQTPFRGLAELPFVCMGYIVTSDLRLVLMLAAASANLVLFGLAWRTLPNLWPPWREKVRGARWFWLSVLLAAVPVALLYGFSLAVTPALASRFLIGILPAYWLVIALLAEYGGRAGRVLLYGVFLPWALVSVGTGFERAFRPSPVRQAASALSTQANPSDLILCSSDVASQFYWEWTRRFGRSNRVECLRPVPSAASPAAPHRRRLEQSERLSVLPWKDLTEIEVGGASRVWLVTMSDSELVARVEDSLAARDFTLESSVNKDSFSVARFVSREREVKQE